MIKKALIFATVAATLTSGAAFAQSHDGRYQRNDRHEQYDRNGSRDYSAQRGDYDRRDGRYAESHRYDRHDGRYAHPHRWDRRDQRSYRYASPYRGHDRYVSVYSAGPRHEFRRGGYLPRHYRGSRYVVHDYRGRYLGAPHRGHQWVQVGNDYLLVALATGLITQVLVNN